MTVDFCCFTKSIDGGAEAVQVLVESATRNGISVLVVSTDGEARPLNGSTQTNDREPDDRVRLVRTHRWTPTSSTAHLAADSTAVPDGPVRCRPDGQWMDVAFDPWLIGDLPVLLVDARKPLIADFVGLTSPPFRSLYELAERHPTLPIVVELGSAGDLDLVIALAETCPFVIVSTRGLMGHQLSAVAERVGARRILFGSGYPTMSHEDALGAVAAWAGPQPIALISHDNGARLLRGDWGPWA